MPIQLSGSLVITGSITTTGVITMSGSIASASYSSTSDLLQGTGSVGFTTTASFNAVSSSQQQISASYIALSASYNTFSGSNSTILTSVSSSQQQISASLLNVISIFATTGSNSFRANQSITGSLVVSSTITAQTLIVQTVTSSIVYSSGSNIFGCDLNSRQTFTGSIYQTGSIAAFAGSVGIGVINPYVKLDVRGGGIAQTTTDFVANSTGSVIYMRTGATTGNTNYGLIQVGNTGDTIGGNLILNQYGGNVGIGTTTPTKKLHISGSCNNSGLSFDIDSGATVIIRGNTTANFDLNNEGTGGCIRLYGSAIQFRTNVADPAVVINNGGCMGINCTAPSGILTVGGDNNQIHVRGGYYASIYGFSGAEQVFGLYGNCDATYLNARGATGLYLGGKTSCNHIYLDTNGITCFFNTVCAPSFKGGTISGTSITGTSMTVATDCSGVIVDVAGRHGLMKYYNFGTGLIGCCTGTDGGISIWLGRFAGSITAPTGVYQDLKIFNNGIAAFACQVCAPSGVKFGSGNCVLNYYEEGKWCIYACGSTSGAGPVGEGSYTRLGRLVTASILINSQTFPSYSGTLRLSMPFTAGTGSGLGGNMSFNAGGVYFYPFSAWCSGTNFIGVDAIVFNSTNYAQLSIGNVNGDRQGAVGSTTTSTSGASGLYLRFTITYEVSQ